MPNEKWLIVVPFIPLFAASILLVRALLWKPKPRKYLKCHMCKGDLFLFPVGCLTPDRAICPACGIQNPTRRLDPSEASSAQSSDDPGKGFLWAPRGSKCYSCGACDKTECAKDRFQLTLVPKGTNETQQP